MSRKSRKSPNRRYRPANAVYVLPNLLTTLNLFFGFLSIIMSINGRFTTAAMALLISILFDILDGRVARMTNATSHFGKEFDSLVDLVSFGVAPAILAYLWGMITIDRFGWLVAFLFVACGSLRLARFNTIPGGQSYFLGFPIPAAAAVISTGVLFCSEFDYIPSSVLVLICLVVLSFLMISNIRYPSMKKSFGRRRINFQLLVVAVLLVVFIAARPKVALFTIAMGYFLSGPIWYGKYLLTRTREPETDLPSSLPEDTSQKE